MDTDIEKKLARLNELEQKVEKIKVSNRERVSAYMDRKRQAGMVQVSALISKQAFEVINNMRDKSILAGRQPETTGSVIERALLSLDIAMDNSVKDNININDSIKQDIDSIGIGCTEGTKQDKIDCLFSEVQAMMDTPPEQSESFSLSPVDEIPPEPFNHSVMDEPEQPEPVTAKLAVEPPEQDILTRIKDMKSRKISYERMAEIFNSEGLKTKRGKPFTRANIEPMYRRR